MKPPKNYHLFSKIAEDTFFKREFFGLPEEILIAQSRPIEAYITLTYLLMRFSYEPKDEYYIWKKNIRYAREEIRKSKLVDADSISILFKIHLGVYARVRQFVLMTSKPTTHFGLKEEDVPENPEWDVIHALSDSFFPSSVYRSQQIGRALNRGTMIVFENILGRFF